MLRIAPLALAFSLCVVTSAACPKTEPAAPPAPAPAPAPATPPATPTPAPPATPPQPEPAGIAPGAHKIPEAPKGKTTWTVDPTGTDVSFTIVSNSAGPITGKLSGAAAGAYDAKSKKGVFTVDLTKLATVSKDGAGNPVRDANVVQAFFGAAPFADAAHKTAVEGVWKTLSAKLQSGVTKAGLVLDGVEGDAATPKEGKSVEGTVNGKLVLWDSVEIPVSFPVTAEKKGDTIEVKSTAPAQFDIEKATGSVIRKGLFDSLLAAGCKHQPGIQNEVKVSLDKVTLKKGK